MYRNIHVRYTVKCSPDEKEEYTKPKEEEELRQWQCTDTDSGSGMAVIHESEEKQDFQAFLCNYIIRSNRIHCSKRSNLTGSLEMHKCTGVLIIYLQEIY